MAEKNGSGRLSVPLYSYAEADHLAGVSRGTSKRWLAGYQYRQPSGKVVQRPPVTPRVERALEEGVSFTELLEIAAIGGLKEIDFTLPEIRRIVVNCREMFHSDHPLVSHRFKTGGREVFVERDERLVEVLRRKGEQAWNEVLEPFLNTLEFEDDLAVRWWPLGRNRNIVVDPDYGFGLPVVAGSGVRTDIILERVNAGDLQEQIAKDFNVDRTDIEYALQFEVKRLRAA